jgi:hypothetical protein
MTDDGETLHGVADNGEHCCLCGGEHATVGHGETFSTCANCYDAFLDSEPWGRDEGLAKLRAEYFRRVSNMLATVPKEKMTAKTITPERLDEIERLSMSPGGETLPREEGRELVRGYRAHLAQPEPDRSGERADLRRRFAELHPDERHEVLAAPYMIEPFDQRLRQLDKQLRECFDRYESAAEANDTLRARIAELESQLANAQRSHEAYRGEAQRIDRGFNDQIAELTALRDRLRSELTASRAEVLRLNELGKKENGEHAMLIREWREQSESQRRTIEELEGELQAERAKVKAAVEQLRELDEVGGKALGGYSFVAMHVRRILESLQPATPKESKPVNGDTAFKFDVNASTGFRFGDGSCTRCGGTKELVELMTSKKTPCPDCAPNPAKEFTTVSGPDTVATPAAPERLTREWLEEYQKHANTCGAHTIALPRRRIVQLLDAASRDLDRAEKEQAASGEDRCPTCDSSAKSGLHSCGDSWHQAASGEDGEQEKRLEDMRATLADSGSFGAFGSILLQYLREEREATR